MAQGKFTKEEVVEVRKSFREIFTALSKPKKMEFLGHANDVYLFLSAVEKVAPNEKKGGK